MRLDCLPFPSAGKPLVVRTIGWFLLAVSIAAGSRPLFLAGAVLVIASTGRDVVVDGGLVLRYALFKIRVSDADEILCLGELERGRLIKWATPLILEPLFLVLSLLIVLSKGISVPFLFPVLDWSALYSEVILVPMKALRERLGLSVLVPLAVSLPPAILNRETLPAMPFIWVTGTLSLMNLLLRDGVIIRVAGRGYLVLCESSKRLMEGLLHGPEDG